jgi:hypothetical protein
LFRVRVPWPHCRAHGLLSIRLSSSCMILKDTEFGSLC